MAGYLTPPLPPRLGQGKAWSHPREAGDPGLTERSAWWCVRGVGRWQAQGSLHAGRGGPFPHTATWGRVIYRPLRGCRVGRGQGSPPEPCLSWVVT